MTGTYFPRELKEEIIGKIKNEGITAAEAGRLYGVNVKNIYSWLTAGIGGARSEILEINRLKRENKQLKQTIGELFLEKTRGKKG